MFDHLLESSHRDDSNKQSNIGFGEEIVIIDVKERSLSGAVHSAIFGGRRALWWPSTSDFRYLCG